MKNLKTTTTNLWDDPEFRKLKYRKLAKYDFLVSKASGLLITHNKDAYKLIRQGFKEYERYAKMEENYIDRCGQLSLLQVLFSSKNPQDIYYHLPDEVKPLWQANKKLEAWRKQYR